MIKLTNKLYGASLIALAFSLNIANANAQTCTTAPSCDTLGFTKSVTDCEGHSILKCPFDQTKFYCDSGASSSGGALSSCVVGSILYSDKTCSAEPISSKIAIGVVFSANRGLAVALEQKQLAWSTESFDIPDLVNRTSESAARGDFAGKTNTASAWKYCKDNGKSCPAFEYVSSYKTQGTNAGDWYLPAGGELNELYESRDAVNVTMAKISGTRLCSGSSSTTCPYPWYWSSSEASNGSAWYQHFYDGGIHSINKSSSPHIARPVLAF